MKIIVCLDNDGHFRAEKLSNRAEVINLLKTFDDGDFWENVIEKNYNEYH